MFSKSSKNFLSSIEFKIFCLFCIVSGLNILDYLRGVTGFPVN